MGDGAMKYTDMAGLILCVAGIACGQILFKLAARTISTGGNLLSAALSPYFIAGVVIYGTTTLAWIWLLSKMTLSKAYPFMALSFVFVPLLSALILGEHINGRYWIGMALIISGLLVTVQSVAR
jgi:drug/metabolite transporter (DMT)-like permease